MPDYSSNPFFQNYMNSGNGQAPMETANPGMGVGGYSPPNFGGTATSMPNPGGFNPNNMGNNWGFGQGGFPSLNQLGQGATSGIGGVYGGGFNPGGPMPGSVTGGGFNPGSTSGWGNVPPMRTQPAPYQTGGGMPSLPQLGGNVYNGGYRTGGPDPMMRPNLNPGYQTGGGMPVRPSPPITYSPQPGQMPGGGYNKGPYGKGPFG